MGEEKIKLLMFADFVSPTGFGNVAMSVAKFLQQTGKYEISVLAINYDGFPVEGELRDYRIYPAKLGGEPYGFSLTQRVISETEPDVIWLLNDVWIINHYLSEIKKLFAKQDKNFKRPKIVTYFPVDAEDHNIGWYKNFDIVDDANVYTKFAQKVVKKVKPELKTNIIGHGIDHSQFYKINGTQAEIKAMILPRTPDNLDSFIVLNANRNQSRKRLDVSMRGFALFAKDKPANVKLYMHCGIEDSST